MKIAAFAAASASLLATSVLAKTIFQEDFSSGDFSSWTVADREGLGALELSPGDFFKDENDLGLKTTQDAKFYGIAKAFDEPFKNKGETLVIQLSVKHQQDIDCGGGYVKVYGPGVDLESLDGDSPYGIMFGPDICGSKKIVHVIFSNKGTNHLIKKSITPPKDVFSHAYTLIVKPDNTYSVLVDNVERESGSLADDWDILPPKKIEDPDVSKPADWVEEKMIDDPSETKPDDWDSEPAEIQDPEATKPDTWDDDMDGEWEVPMVPNPEYKGVWRPQRIENPDYMGPWIHPMIDNPDFEDDPTLYEYELGAIGIDVWQVKSGSIFDDILVTTDVELASNSAKAIIERQEAEKTAKKAADEEVAAETAKKAAEQAKADEDFAEFDDDEEDEKDEL